MAFHGNGLPLAIPIFAAPVLFAAVLVAVRHAEVIAYRLGQPLGSIPLALARPGLTIPTVALISLAMGRDRRQSLRHQRVVGDRGATRRIRGQRGGAIPTARDTGISLSPFDQFEHAHERCRAHCPDPTPIRGLHAEGTLAVRFFLVTDPDGSGFGVARRQGRYR